MKENQPYLAIPSQKMIHFRLQQGTPWWKKPPRVPGKGVKFWVGFHMGPKKWCKWCVVRNLLISSWGTFNSLASIQVARNMEKYNFDSIDSLIWLYIYIHIYTYFCLRDHMIHTNNKLTYRFNLVTSKRRSKRKAFPHVFQVPSGKLATFYSPGQLSSQLQSTPPKIKASTRFNFHLVATCSVGFAICKPRFLLESSKCSMRLATSSNLFPWSSKRSKHLTSSMSCFSGSPVSRWILHNQPETNVFFWNIILRAKTSVKAHQNGNRKLIFRSNQMTGFSLGSLSPHLEETHFQHVKNLVGYSCSPAEPISCPFDSQIQISAPAVVVAAAGKLQYSSLTCRWVISIQGPRVLKTKLQQLASTQQTNKRMFMFFVFKIQRLMFPWKKGNINKKMQKGTFANNLINQIDQLPCIMFL